MPIKTALDGTILVLMGTGDIFVAWEDCEVRLGAGGTGQIGRDQPLRSTQPGDVRLYFTDPASVDVVLGALRRVKDNLMELRARGEPVPAPELSALSASPPTVPPS